MKNLNFGKTDAAQTRVATPIVDTAATAPTATDAAAATTAVVMPVPTDADTVPTVTATKPTDAVTAAVMPDPTTAAAPTDDADSAATTESLEVVPTDASAEPMAELDETCESSFVLKPDRIRRNKLVWTIVGGILLGISAYLVFGRLPACSAYFAEQDTKGGMAPATQAASSQPAIPGGVPADDSATAAPSEVHPGAATGAGPTIDLSKCGKANIVVKGNRVTFRNCVR